MQIPAIQQSLAPYLEPSLEAMGYRLVRIIWQGSDKRRVLQLMAERADAAEMTVDDCAEISHTVSAILDVKDPIEGAYELEVSSPGIDRPLMHGADFAHYIGHEVKLEMAVPQASGRRRFRGVILGVDGQTAQLQIDNEVLQLPVEEMATAKLVMTNALMKAAAQRHESKQTKQQQLTDEK